MNKLALFAAAEMAARFKALHKEMTDEYERNLK